MPTGPFLIEPQTPFAQSLIWQLNRDFYQANGIAAWSDDIVPHHMTSNAAVGKTYAELILAFLTDLSLRGATEATVYLIELGAGHGRLAFHILKHLEQLVETAPRPLPPYCYILSDIVEANLTFFHQHPQLQTYFERGILDVAYFDAVASDELYLQRSETTLSPASVAQPVLAIANYFFDSIPNDLFYLADGVISACTVAITATTDPTDLPADHLLQQMDLTYERVEAPLPVYPDKTLNTLLAEYARTLSPAPTHLFFPEQSMGCLDRLRALSRTGLLVLTMDKGFHELYQLQQQPEPDVVTHGSFSLWVNYHALSAYCTQQGGTVFFPDFANFHMEVGCMLFVPDGQSYTQTAGAYDRYVNDFGPDDFNSIKQLTYFNVAQLKLNELIALYRLSAYDSTYFVKLLPRLKQVARSVTYSERKRLLQTVDRVWDLYFDIREELDLAYELGGLLYDLGYYAEALPYFQYSVTAHGWKPDVYYNVALCHYQLRQDRLFAVILAQAKRAFPESALFDHLEKLDMGAA